MRRFFRSVAATFIAFGGFSASPAQAQQNLPSDLTVVGKFYKDSGTSVLFVVTSKPTEGKVPKGAMVGVEFENSDEKYHFNGTYTKLIATFLNADDWRKFVSIWNKARAARAETKDGFYFDGQTELGVGTSIHGEVSFFLAGNGHDERNVPKDTTMFYLPAKDVATFDRDVRQVSAYFAK